MMLVVTRVQIFRRIAVYYDHAGVGCGRDLRRNPSSSHGYSAREVTSPAAVVILAHQRVQQVQMLV